MFTFNNSCQIPRVWVDKKGPAYISEEDAFFNTMTSSLQQKSVSFLNLGHNFRWWFSNLCEGLYLLDLFEKLFSLIFEWKKFYVLYCHYKIFDETLQECNYLVAQISSSCFDFWWLKIRVFSLEKWHCTIT